MNQIKLTTRGQYAVMVMLKLAKANHNQPIPLSDIADLEELNLSNNNIRDISSLSDMKLLLKMFTSRG